MIQTKAITISDTEDVKPTPMTSIPVPHDKTQSYVGNSVFTSIVYNSQGVYYKALKNVPKNIELTNKQYWKQISSIQEVGIHRAFINMLLADNAFVNFLSVKLANIENANLTNVNVDGYIRHKWLVVDMKNDNNWVSKRLAQHTIFENYDSDFRYYLEFETSIYTLELGRSYEFVVLNQTRFMMKIDSSYSDLFFKYFKRDSGDIDDIGEVSEVWVHGGAQVRFLFTPERIEHFDEGMERDSYVGRMVLLNYGDFIEDEGGTLLRSKPISN